jgi:hypothetical protein
MSRGTVEIVVYGSFIKQKKAVRDDGAPFFDPCWLIRTVLVGGMESARAIRFKM